MYVCLWSYVHFAAKITHDYMYCVHTAAAVTENISCVCVWGGEGGAKQRHPLKKKRISDKAIDIHVALAQHLYYMYMYGSLPPATP